MIVPPYRTNHQDTQKSRRLGESMDQYDLGDRLAQNEEAPIDPMSTAADQRRAQRLSERGHDDEAARRARGAAERHTHAIIAVGTERIVERPEVCRETVHAHPGRLAHPGFGHAGGEGECAVIAALVGDQGAQGAYEARRDPAMRQVAEETRRAAVAPGDFRPLAPWHQALIGDQPIQQLRRAVALRTSYGA